jgi:hypothetical protein
MIAMIMKIDLRLEVFVMGCEFFCHACII